MLGARAQRSQSGLFSLCKPHRGAVNSSKGTIEAAICFPSLFKRHRETESETRTNRSISFALAVEIASCRIKSTLPTLEYLNSPSNKMAQRDTTYERGNMAPGNMGTNINRFEEQGRGQMGTGINTRTTGESEGYCANPATTNLVSSPSSTLDMWVAKC